MRTAVPIILLLIMLLLLGCGNGNSNKTKRRVTREDLIAVNKVLVSRDSLVIAEYVENKGIDNIQVSSTGLWVALDSCSSVSRIVKGDAVELAYKVSFLDGEECYNSLQSGNKKFVAGMGSEIPGIEEAVMLMGPGCKAIVVVPPHLAYGLVGDDNKIPGRSILRYDLEVVAVVKAR